MQKGNNLLIKGSVVATTLIFGITVSILYIAYVYLTQPDNPIKQMIFPNSPTPLITPVYTGDWKTYVNSKYKFTLKYPDTYQVEKIDEGFPNALLILYKGGQTYDLVVEAWDKEADYKSKYSILSLSDNITVKKNGQKIITFFNSTNSTEATQIISTYKEL